MYQSDRSGPGRRAAHLPPSGHVCPLQGGHEPGTGLSGKTHLSCGPTLLRMSGVSPSSRCLDQNITINTLFQDGHLWFSGEDRFCDVK